ncbi:pyruvate dehydrogenase E1 component domain protein [Mycobacterium xenopi 4042]|uniref:Pyruvate dehydrogenase E1 component domain protein n=1 Tax=Mycobacterium xenopi 4042 TaxID=1299334 RepID=X8DDT6_MYCXE|nr:pyruvate dehydrogenase E1 component domain protein [Mycobacterium xenopi 4042]
MGRAAARRPGRRVGQPDEHHPDGDYQTYKANDGAYVREHFFGRDPAQRSW